MSRLDIGRRVDEHVRPDTPALQGFAFARCCGFSSASIPHALTGKVGSGSRRFRPHAVAYDLWLPPAGSIRDLHPPPFIHARRTQSPYGLLPIPPRSLSLPTYSCVDPPPPSTLISRGEVSHRGWHRGLPQARWTVHLRSAVGSRAGAVLRRRGLSVSPRFLWECLTSRTVSPFPAPATIARSVRLSRTTRSCTLPAKGCDLSSDARVRAHRAPVVSLPR